MKNDIDAQFLCKDCSRYSQCQYYHNRKEDSYICKYFEFHLAVPDKEPCEDATLKDIFCTGCEHKEQQPCEDAVSRKAVISILKEKWNMFSDANDSMQESINTIEAIPSVTPIRPKDDVLDKIKAEIEQMNNLDYVEPITVDEVLKIIDKYKAESEERDG